MAEKYYLKSKDVGEGAYLIGELVRLAKGEYRFRYMLPGDRFPDWYVQIPGFRDTRRIYETQEVKRYIIHRIVPDEGTWAARVIMAQNGITAYDEWDILVALIDQHALYQFGSQPLSDSHELFYFYSTIHE